MLHPHRGRARPHPGLYTATLAPQAAEALATEHAERGRNPVSSSTKPTCWTTISSKRSGS